MIKWTKYISSSWYKIGTFTRLDINKTIYVIRDRENNPVKKGVYLNKMLGR